MTDPKQDSEWVTVGGKHIEIKPGEDIEEKTREKLPSLRGEKEKNTKEAIRKSYVKRYNLNKSLFKIRDKVVFDEYKKSGIVAGLDNDYLRVLSNGKIETIQKNSTFKKSELIGNTHWDTMTRKARLQCLKKSNLGVSYVDRNWQSLQPNLRSVIRKINSPAGYDSPTSGSNNPIYNPINEDKTVSQRIKEELSRQHEDKEGVDDETKRNYS